MNEFVEIELHCHRIKELLFHLDNILEIPVTAMADGNTVSLFDAIEWFQMASAVESVSLDLSRFDISGMYCRGAWEYDVALNELRSKYAKELTIFTYAWCGFECVAKAMMLERYKSDGTTSIVAYTLSFFRHVYRHRRPLHAYTDCYSSLATFLSTHSTYAPLLHRASLSRPPPPSPAGVGLHLVRFIRNKFAHGNISLPTPEDWGDDERQLASQIDTECRIIELSTRIILFSVQHVLIGITKKYRYRYGYT